MYKLILIASVLSVVFAGEETAETIQFNSDINPDGSYQFNYDTSNGISGQESGVGGVSATGEVKYVSPEGTPIQLSYVADEEGFKPKGDHLPVAPEVPPHVLRLVEWLEQHPSDDDGSYKP